MVYFLVSMFFSHIFVSPVYPYCSLCLGPKEGILSWTVHSHHAQTSHTFVHRPFPCTQTFSRSVIECTATNHVIFSWCIYASFHGNIQTPSQSSRVIRSQFIRIGAGTLIHVTTGVNCCLAVFIPRMSSYEQLCQQLKLKILTRIHAPNHVYSHLYDIYKNQANRFLTNAYSGVSFMVSGGTYSGWLGHFLLRSWRR